MDAVDQLRAWRGTRSFVSVAREVECDPSHLFRIEKRLGRPGIDVRRKLEAAVGIGFNDWDAVELDEVARAAEAARRKRSAKRKRRAS